MKEKIELEIKYTVDEYVRSISTMQNRFLIFKYFPYVGLLAAIGLIINYLLIAPTIISGLVYLTYPVIGTPILVLLIISIWLKFFTNPFLKWNISRQYKSSPTLQETKRLQFDEEGISSSSQLGKTETKWEAVIEAVESKKDFFFYITNKYAQFVPKRAFTSVEQQNELRHLVKQKLGDKAKF